MEKVYQTKQENNVGVGFTPTRIKRVTARVTPTMGGAFPNHKKDKAREK